MAAALVLQCVVTQAERPWPVQHLGPGHTLTHPEVAAAPSGLSSSSLNLLPRAISQLWARAQTTFKTGSKCQRATSRRAILQEPCESWQLIPPDALVPEQEMLRCVLQALHTPPATISPCCSLLHATLFAGFLPSLSHCLTYKASRNHLPNILRTHLVLPHF